MNGRRAVPLPPPPPPLLHKQHSWSPDVHREEAWLRRKESFALGRITKSVTDDDLEDLKACIELGFGFDASAVVDPKLADALPALGLYQAVHRRYNRSLSRSSSAASFASSSSSEDEIDGDSFYDPGDDPVMVKTRLRQWAQVVACFVRQTTMSCSPLLPPPPPP
ncbi:hypothetical protein MLD38_023331 [Melastoma candidum]|uniref:Uncharacterized protein n=1 Tax=Melastoma candidum TaxID=119954 RepID=A0ACB9QM59_9MYRT|nr:hypothetical protein MLD38_023331 [Melastoma candidum]